MIHGSRNHWRIKLRNLGGAILSTSKGQCWLEQKFNNYRVYDLLVQKCDGIQFSSCIYKFDCYVPIFCCDQAEANGYVGDYCCHFSPQKTKTTSSPILAGFVEKKQLIDSCHRRKKICCTYILVVYSHCNESFDTRCE
jgi:hypothetical protein